MDILIRLDQTRSACNVLEHPFYERWSAGELTAGELGRYDAEPPLAIAEGDAPDEFVGGARP